MSQATEMELRELLQKYLEANPLRETVYIKILDNTVEVVTDVAELEGKEDLL